MSKVITEKPNRRRSIFIAILLLAIIAGSGWQLFNSQFQPVDANDKTYQDIIIPASRLGKIKTISQIVAVILIILEKAYQPYINIPLGQWMMYFAVVITLISGFEYFYRFKLHSDA